MQFFFPKISTNPQSIIEAMKPTKPTAIMDLRPRLSERRAQAVADYLTAHGVDGSILSVRGYGESTPIADNGTGVTSANREKIFEHFFTTRRDRGGTGLGLGIVRALLTAHGGQITLQERTSGAAFTIKLAR